MPVPPWLLKLSGGLISALEKNPRIPDPGMPRRVSAQFGQWAAHLSQSITTSFTPYLLRGEQCSFCDEDALNDCISCGDPCCLAHAHVSHRAELLCDECVGDVTEKRGKRSKADQAFAYFNLNRNASWEDVQAMFRYRSKGQHPDQGGSGQSVMSAHYQVLKEHLEKKRAAA